jgi:hypothetical protein
MRRSLSLASSDERHGLSVRERYYRADLLHCWANLLMVAGGRCSFLYARILRKVTRMYDATGRDSDLMDNGYYWMRHLEARIMSGAGVDLDGARARLDSIGRAYVLTRNIVQIGNAHAYRALLEWSTGAHPLRSNRA